MCYAASTSIAARSSAVGLLSSLSMSESVMLADASISANTFS